jgi:selenocysteine lyase/cysteine desulfurase
MHSVADAAKEGIARKAHPWDISSEDFFNQTEDLRTSAAKLFHCTASDVAILPSASYGAAIAARNLPVVRGQKILVLQDQFPSNFYSWLRLAKETGAELVTAPWPEDGDWTASVLRVLNQEVAIAALPQTHWTSGGLLDLERIGEACRSNGTTLALDLTQSLGAYPFEVKKVLPDFAFAATYKWLMGPYSLGLMYVAPKWHDGRPLEENWIQRDNARNFSDLIHYTDHYEPGARRFDVGERSNFALLPAAILAIEQLLAWRIGEISQTIGALNRRLLETVSALRMSAPPEHLRAPHYLCLRSEGPLVTGLVENLTKERIYVSVRGSSIRVTPHLYNSQSDIHHLATAIERNYTP